jgi:hypothetical protein
MTKHFRAVIFSAILTPAYCQMYLVTGSPTPKYNQSFASMLFRVGDDGSLKSVAELVPKDVQTQWMTISYESRVMVIRTNLRIIALSLDKATVIKSCRQPATPPGLRSIVDQWLLAIPSKGATVAEAYFDGSGFAMWGPTMDPSIPCDKSFQALRANDLRFAVMHGRSGVVDVGSSDLMGVFPKGSGRINVSWPEAGETDFGYDVPLNIPSNNRVSETLLVINNHQLLSLIHRPDRDARQNQRALVLKKKDKAWRRLPLPTERFDWQRGFGHFIAVAEARTKDAQNTESAGRAEWRKTESQMGPSIQTRFDDADVVFPGRLYLYDVDTERVYAITTNQGDSEILLVENNIIYYRASDRLYSISITGNGLGTARLLATNEAIRDAHWAFIKH